MEHSENKKQFALQQLAICETQLKKPDLDSETREALESAKEAWHFTARSHEPMGSEGQRSMAQMLMGKAIQQLTEIVARENGGS